MTELTGTKLRIVDCSIELFAKRGYNDVSVRDIARAVGIKDASIYSHFSSKDEIFDTIFHLMRQEYLKDLPEAEELDAILARSSPSRFLETGFKLFQKRLSDPKQTSIHLILLREKYNDSRASLLWRDHLDYGLKYMKRVFSKMAEKGWIKSKDLDQTVASYFWAGVTLRGEYVHLLSQGKDTGSIENQIRQHIHFFLELIKND